MKTPDKIYIPNDIKVTAAALLTNGIQEGDVEYIRKDALMEWVKSEMERLWELLPDADNPNPTQMELRYLGQYMQMEALEDKLNSM